MIPTLLNNKISIYEKVQQEIKRLKENDETLTKDESKNLEQIGHF